ncbi:unnamed protein product [Pedinophyceae sp. YPF-701]|nr:unnamed protein product [Pedinophyceae sp. YPF-701]
MAAEPVRASYSLHCSMPCLRATDDGVDSFLPPFANAENKALDRQIKSLERELESGGLDLEESGDRIKIMGEHLKNVRNEIQYTQSRLEAKKKELSTEEHLKAMLQRECGRLRSDIEKLEVERDQAADRAARVQVQIEAGNERMEQFKMKMNWNQEELESWALASRQKEEDVEALARYGRTDDGRMKDLAIALEKVAREATKAQQDLEDEVTETQAAQIQLDKTAEDFKALHMERLELVRQWEEALEEVKRRDEAIQAASEKFAARKAALREVRARLAEQERFLEAERANNRELEQQVAVADREVAGQREGYAREQARAAEAADALAIATNTLSRIRGDLQKQRANNDNIRDDLSRKERRLERVREKYAAEADRLEGELAQLDSLEKKAAQLEEMSVVEAGKLKSAMKEAAQLKETVFRRSEVLFDLRRKERELVAEISGGQGQLKNMDAKIRGLEAQVVKQEELIYNADFQIQVIERKVARAQGERTDEEKRALNARIEELTQELEGVNAEHSMLLSQVKRAEEDLYRAKRRHMGLREESDRLENTVAALNLEVDETTRGVKAAVRDKEERMVGHDVMRLEAKRLAELLSSRADEVFSLENKRAQMQLSLEERRQEVDVHMEALKAELRLSSEDNHRLVLELKEREQALTRLEAKFGVLSRKGKPTDEEGEQVSQAYFVIKAAQEREELQREGDELDAKIQKAEKEVRALETTLERLNGTNNNFRASLRTAEAEQVAAEQSELRERLDRAYDRVKIKRGAEKELRRDMAQVQEHLEQLTREEQRTSDAITQMGRQKVETDALIRDQEEKSARAQRRLEALRRDLRARAGTGAEEATPQEMDVELADMRDLNRAVLQELRSLAQANPGAGISEQLEVAGLRAAGPGSRGGRPASSTSAATRGTTPGQSSRGPSRAAVVNIGM